MSLLWHAYEGKNSQNALVKNTLTAKLVRAKDQPRLLANPDY